MLRIDETDFSTINPQDFSAREWGIYKQHVVEQAHRARSELLKALVLQLTRAVAKRTGSATQRIGQAWTRWRTDVAIRRMDRNAIARLKSLDDCALKDIGIQRTEIESIVHAHDDDDTRKRRTDRLAA
ncbi:MAG: hypothetical protein ACXWJW_09665 [Xanthobacteraceae bacterium]